MSSSPMKWFWEIVGWVSLALGFLGIPLPLLPTTPFILLAIYAFAKSRPSMKTWILNHKLIGPPVKKWQEKKGISTTTRFSALGTIFFSFTLSIWFLRDRIIPVFILSLLGLFLLVLVMRLPIVEDESDL